MGNDMFNDEQLADAEVRAQASGIILSREAFLRRLHVLADTVAHNDSLLPSEVDLSAHDAALRASNAAMREALRHAARELQYIREAGRCDQGSLHVSGEGLACIALAESLLGPMRDWPEEPNASARAAEASPSASDGGGGEHG